MIKSKGVQRLIRVAVALLVLPLLGAAASRPEADSTDWPQFRGNPALTGVSMARLPSELELKWTYDFGEAVESSSAIVDGVVYAASQAGELVALDLTDGSVRWNYQDVDRVGESSPAVADGIVYIGDLAGTVHAVDAATGAGLWTYQTEGEIKASPTVIDERLLIGSYDEHLYALSARSGELLWKLQTMGPVHATAGVLDGIAYIAGCDEVFRGVRVSDGEELLQIKVGAYVGASPALSGEQAYFGTFNNEVLRIDRASRSIAWRYSHPQRSFPFYSSAAFTEGRLVLGGRDRLVHCLDASTGESLWTFATRARVESSPAVLNGRVYIGSNDGTLYALDISNGSKLWEFEVGAAITASPAIAGERLVVGAFDGRLYCFG